MTNIKIFGYIALPLLITLGICLTYSFLLAIMNPYLVNFWSVFKNALIRYGIILYVVSTLAELFHNHWIYTLLPFAFLVHMLSDRIKHTYENISEEEKKDLINIIANWMRTNPMQVVNYYFDVVRSKGQLKGVITLEINPPIDYGALKNLQNRLPKGIELRIQSQKGGIDRH